MALKSTGIKNQDHSQLKTIKCLKNEKMSNKEYIWEQNSVLGTK